MKSFKRLGIDPLAVYGTLCVKCPVADPSLASPDWGVKVAVQIRSKSGRTASMLTEAPTAQTHTQRSSRHPRSCRVQPVPPTPRQVRPSALGGGPEWCPPSGSILVAVLLQASLLEGRVGIDRRWSRLHLLGGFQDNQDLRRGVNRACSCGLRSWKEKRDLGNMGGLGKPHAGCHLSGSFLLRFTPEG